MRKRIPREGKVKGKEKRNLCLDVGRKIKEKIISLVWISKEKGKENKCLYFYNLKFMTCKKNISAYW